MSHIAGPPQPEFPAERFDVIATPFHRFLHTEAAGGVVLEIKN